MLRIAAQLNAPLVANAPCSLAGFLLDYQAARTSMSDAVNALMPIGHVAQQRACGLHIAIGKGLHSFLDKGGVKPRAGLGWVGDRSPEATCQQHHRPFPLQAVFQEPATAGGVCQQMRLGKLGLTSAHHLRCWTGRRDS